MNCYIERKNGGGFAMFKHFGQRPFKRVAVGEGCRGLLLDPTNGHLFNVFGGTVYDVLADGTIHFTYAGLANDGLPVSITASQNTLFIVSQKTLYRINSAAMSTPLMPPGVAPIAVGVIGDLVLVLADGTNKIYWSDDDGATWAATAYQQIQAFPNRLVNLVIDHQEIWAFGNRHVQVFVLGDDPEAPLVPLQSGMIEFGLGAMFGVTRMDNSIFWIGQNKDGHGTVYRARGYEPQRISTHAVENALQEVGDDGVAQAVMGAYQLNGHTCLRIMLPTANNGLGSTWEYDASLPTELAWREVGWWNWRQGYYERHRSTFYASAFGKVICGDHSNGWLYQLTPQEYTDFGYPLRWFRRAPHLAKGNKEVSYSEAEIVFQAGVGLVTPLWLHSYNMGPADFASALAVQVGFGNVTAAEALILQDIYNGDPYIPLNPYPSPDTMSTLGFFPWGTYSMLSDDTRIGAPPLINIRYSDYRGEEGTFKAYYSKNMGLHGQNQLRANWTDLGQGRGRVWEAMGEDPVKYAILEFNFEATVCQN